MTYGCKTTHNGVLIDREFRDEVLDMDKSKGDVHSDVINTFRFIRLCGLLFEQVSCNTLTAEATFQPVGH
jgi:hypothetical protein